jgi:hypothetical protein
MLNQDVIVYDGIGANVLGYEMFERFVTTINYADRTIELSRESPPHGSLRRLAFVDGNVPVVRAKADNIGGWFQLDTGSGRSLTLARGFVARHHQIASGVLTSPEVTGGTSVPGGATNACLADISEFELAGWRIVRPLTFLSTDTAGAFANDAIAGNVGNDLLQLFSLTLDYQHGLAEFSPSPEFYRRKPERLGVMVVDTADGPSIGYVRSGSASDDAGLRSSDIILKLDGRDVSRTPALDLSNQLNADPQTRHLITVRRGITVETHTVAPPTAEFSGNKISNCFRAS